MLPLSHNLEVSSVNNNNNNNNNNKRSYEATAVSSFICIQCKQ